MRKILMICAVVLTMLIITGCEEEETIDPLPLLTERYAKKVVNETVLYEIDTDYIKFYEDNDGNQLVGILDVLDALDDSLRTFDELEVNRDMFKMRFKGYNYNDPYNPIEYDMILDAEKDTLSISNMAMLGMINQSGENPFTYQVLLHDLALEDGAVETEIALNDYGYDVISFEEDIYVPLSFIDLFFAGDGIFLYETKDNVLILDYYTLRSGVIDEYEQKPKDDLAFISEETNHFLALYFDYFYGLKEIYTEDTFINYLEPYDIESSTSYEDLYTKIDTFIVELDDLHSNMVYPGYNYKEYTLIDDFDPDSKRAYYQSKKDENMCHLETEPYTISSDEDTIYIKLNTFSLSIEKLITEYRSIRNKDYVKIDLSCNSGGNLYATFLAISMVTSKPIPVHIYDRGTDLTNSYYYLSPVSHVKDADYEIITSYVTYSAANLFVSILKDLDAATFTGTNTGGGASPVDTALLPDGTLISISSNQVLLDNDMESIEDGILID